MSNRSSLAILGLTLFSFVLNGCNPSSATRATEKSSTGLNGRLTITGSSTAAPLVAEIARRFEQIHTGVRIDVQTGGSGKGIVDTRNQVADLGMASRSLKEGEHDLVAHPFAADGVCLIVHTSNAIGELSDQQVIDIYFGKIRNWNELGGPDEVITVVHKAEGRATLEVFLQHFDIENPSVRADVIVGDNEHAVKTVAGVEGAIGYVSIRTAEADAQLGIPIRRLPIAGVDATTENVASGAFPLSRPLILVSPTSPSPLATAFIHYCQSEEVHDLVVSQYFVPIQP